jgi:hypothetical protein
LVTAYLDRRISRRTLVRRLIAGGVSTGAAISYAQILDPQRAVAATTLTPVSDHYPLLDLTILSPTFATVKNNATLRVGVTSSEEIRSAFFRAFFKTATGGVPLGGKSLAPLIKAAGTTEIKITQLDVAALGTATQGTFYVQAQGLDAERYPVLASTSKTLT